MSVAAVLLAGGSGRRMGHEVNKVYLPVAGRVLIDRPLAVLDAADGVELVVLVVRPDDRAEADAAVERVVRRTPVRIVEGGASRTASELAALAVIRGIDAEERPAVTLIHDGARPFLTHDLLDRLVRAAVDDGGAIPGTPVREPLVETDDGGVPRSRPTDGLVRVQTPQAFRTEALLDAYSGLGADSDSVDTAHVVERHGGLPVRVVLTDDRNIKVTRPDDLDRAEQLDARWHDGHWVDDP